MDKDFFIQLTIGVYKVTEMFSKKEPLKILIRKRANLALADLIVLYSGSILNEKILIQRILENIAVLYGYFEIADQQNWMDKRNFLVLRANYDRIKNHLRKRTFAESDRLIGLKDTNKGNFNEIFPKKIAFTSKNKDVNINSKTAGHKRREKIIKILEINKKICSKELLKEFPKISDRTIRRDIDYLIKNNIIKKQGNGIATFYELNQTA